MNRDVVTVNGRDFPAPVAFGWTIDQSAWEQARGASEFITDRELITQDSTSVSSKSIDLRVESVEHLQRLRPIVGRCLELLDLEPNWDSYGACAPRFQLVEKAVRLITEVLRYSELAPQVVPTNRGGIQFEWSSDGRDLELEVHASGRLTVLYEDESTGEDYETELAGDIGPIIERLTKVAG